MNRGTLITLGIIGVIVLIIFYSFSGTYNSMVEKQETVEQAWAQVAGQYQRRLDLIPNLIETVKGVSNFEKTTLTDVVEARSRAGSVQLTKEALNDEQAMKNYMQAQGQLQGAISRLLVVSENYPELKSNQSFQDLMAQLEGTENRIANERKRYGDAVKDYNTYIRKFPNSIYASVFGFEKKAYFEAEAGAEKAPKVKF